jgi:two-component system heavy metal sensor histidine kinase CusS
VRPGSRNASLAARLVLLFGLGSAAIMAAAGYALYHALKMELESKDLAEITGKTEVVEHLLREFDSLPAFEANLARIRDVTVGHPHLSIGVLQSGRWLVPLGEPALAAAAREPGARSAIPFEAVESGPRIWLVHRVRHAWPGGASTDVVVATETTETRALLRDHAIIAFLVAITGTAASALLALFVVRRGLAPLSELAARAGEVTAQRLGARLDLAVAPLEVHGLADSINRMLERLEESFRALEQFSADIAHELRTPLNNLLLQTQVTLSRPRPVEEYQEALHSNLEELERLQRMVSEMLFLARADRGMIELSEEEIDLAAEAANVANYFEAAASEKSQAIAVLGDARIRADRSLVRRAITNLLSNAVRYSPPAARIEVRIESSPSEATVAVSNPGGEIAAPDLKRLFVRFARRDESRARSVEGAGLGLAIVDSIMKLQHGSVDASSLRGGVTFVLRFPAPGARS